MVEKKRAISHGFKGLGDQRVQKEYVDVVNGYLCLKANCLHIELYPRHSTKGYCNCRPTLAIAFDIAIS